jgi:hypothetical protein
MSAKNNNAARFRKYAVGQQIATEPEIKPIDIEQEVARKQQLENENTAQDIRLKRITINRLFVFLGIETALIFMYAFFQAVHWPAQFQLEEWSFRLVVGATIAQITGMLFVAVRYLFPNK